MGFFRSVISGFGVALGVLLALPVAAAVVKALAIVLV